MIKGTAMKTKAIIAAVALLVISGGVAAADALNSDQSTSASQTQQAPAETSAPTPAPTTTETTTPTEEAPTTDPQPTDSGSPAPTTTTPVPTPKPVPVAQPVQNPTGFGSSTSQPSTPSSEPVYNTGTPNTGGTPTSH